MNNITKTICSIAAAILLFSCSGSSASETFDAQNNNPDSIDDTEYIDNDTGDEFEAEQHDSDITDSVAEEASPDRDINFPNTDIFPDLSGTWAQKQWYSSKAKVYTFENAKGWVRTYFLVHQEQQGDTVFITAQTCHITIANNTDMMNLLIPDTYINALEIQKKTAQLAILNGIVQFHQPRFWEIRSIDSDAWDNPESYTLPLDPKDPAVEDWDNDGEPGMRSLVKSTLVNAEIHTVQKVSHELTGTVVDADTITGTVSWTDLQEILKSDSDFIKNALSDTTNIIDTKRENIWEQHRMPADTTCIDIIDNVDTIFSPDPVDID